MNRKEDIDARIETLQEELVKLKNQRERLEIPVTERIKTFDDAVDELGSEHPLVKQYMAANGDESFTRNTIAYMKLQIIVCALNEGWFPDLLNKEIRRYPYFRIITRSEIEEKSEEWKSAHKFAFLCDISSSGASCGIVSVYSHHAWSSVRSPVSSRLSANSKKIAMYFGNQFIDIWAEYLLG